MKTSLLKSSMVLLMSFIVSNAFSQEPSWEYVRSIYSNDTVTPNVMQLMTELESGDIIVNASWADWRLNGGRSENPGIMKFSADGELLGEVYWSRYGYRSDDQYIIESPDHEIIVMGHFLPDKDPNAGQFELEYSDKAYLYFYKLDNNLNMLDSVEYLIPLDTIKTATFYEGGNPFYNINMSKIKLTSAFIEDDHIVGSYTKIPNRCGTSLDTLFFFKMDFDGNILVEKSLPLGDMGSDPYAFNDQMISNELGYVHYHVNKQNTKYIEDYCVVVDKDFNYVKKMGIPILHQNGWPRSIDFEMVRKSPWGTTFLSCLIDHGSSSHDAYLMEIDETNPGWSGEVGVLHRKEEITNDYDMTAIRSPACFTEDAIFWAYTRNRGFFPDYDSWIEIKKLNRNFDVVQEVYYPYQERTNLNANSYIVSRDGGVLLLSYCYYIDNLDSKHFILTKFPAEAFLGIEEAHNHGLKLAVAYPNPGNVALNIRTALQDAVVEVYDVQGRKVAEQAIGGIITTLDTESWPSGMYLWNVLQDGKVSETGKWVKE